jgi:hypothetical protein
VTFGGDIGNIGNIRRRHFAVGDILPWATFCCIKKSDILSRDILSGDI